MDWLDSIPPDFRGLAIVVFVIASTLLAAWSSRRGAREPDDHEPKVREFAVTGQLADMGPIRELVEQAGLLVQQQVKTNVQLDHLCQSIDRAISEWNSARERENREEEIERRVAERLEQERRRPARRGSSTE